MRIHVGKCNLNAKANSGLGSRFERLPGSWPGAWAEKQRPPLDIYPVPVQLKQQEQSWHSFSSSSSSCGSTKQSPGKQPGNVIKK